MFDSITLNSQNFSGNTLDGLVKNKLEHTDTPYWEQEIYAFIRELRSNDDFITTTSSGTTGAPKSIRLSKSELVASAKRTEKYFKLRKGQHALLCLPAHYIAGKMMIVRAFVSGLNLWLTPPSSIPFQGLTHQLDFVALTPHQLSNSVELLQNQPQAVRQIIVGGAPVPLPLMKNIKNLTCQVFETYGMTETCSHIAIKPLNGPHKSTAFELLDGFDIQTDERNCLKIHFSNVTEKPDIQTNDVVEITGRSFKWLGRYDNMINSGGIKLFPEQIEKKLTDFSQFPLAISAKYDNKLGEKLILVIETAKLKKQELVTLENLLIEKLSRMERPRELALLNSFPRTQSGKLKRKELQDLLNRSSNVYFVTLNK